MLPFAPHTHAPTADHRVMPEGAAHVSGLGMVGPFNFVIGSDPVAVLEKILTQTPRRFTVAKGPVAFNSAIIDMDDATGRARSIQRIDRMVD